jgi:flagellar basal body-associated protein FliL
MKLFKNKLVLTILGILIGVTAVSAGATISYVYNKQVNQSVTVGETVKYTDGIIIELIDYDPYTLTYLELEETDTQKHYVTYTYSYEFVDSELDILVSSLSDDIEVTNLSSTDTTISITFMLNQDKTFTKGEVLNIEFYFEGITPPEWDGNINSATIEQLESVGFTNAEAIEIYDCDIVFTDLDDLYNYIYISEIHTRFDDKVAEGYITFN